MVQGALRMVQADENGAQKARTAGDSMTLQNIATSTQLTDDEYLPIWTALMETSRGRCFLREFARRTRASETRTLLDAVQKLENALLDARNDAPAPQPTAASQTDNRSNSDLQAAIAQAVPALEYAARIGARARADLQEAADDIQIAVNALRPLLEDHAAATARNACDRIDARILDIDEIVAVQQLGDDQAAAATSALAELVTAAPRREAPAFQAEAMQSGARTRPARAVDTARARTAPDFRAASGTPAPQRPRSASPSPANAAPSDPSDNPAVQKLIQEITSRLLNNNGIGPVTSGR